MYNNVKKSTEYIMSQVTNRPCIAIILGSGLGDLANDINNKKTIKYSLFLLFQILSLYNLLLFLFI